MIDILAMINWGAEPEILKLGPLSLRWYGLLFALGFVVGYMIMQKIFVREGKGAKLLDSLTVFMVVGTVAGARLGHCLFYEPTYYLSNPLKILAVWEGGLASHGAAIGILLSLWFFAKKNPTVSFTWILDRIVIVVALAGSFIRLGNFFNSEILGSYADVPWGVVFTRLGETMPRHPAQIYESLFYLVSFLILYFTYNKNYQKLGSGFLFGLFLILIFGARFIIEFFKDPQTQFEVGMMLNMGQLLSIPFVLIGVLSIVYSYRSKKSKL